MSKKKGNYQIPFKNGNLQSYPYNPDEWRDNYEFEETLEYVTYYRGRSSATIAFKDSQGHTYEMFLTDFDDVMKRKGFNGKFVTGKWTFVKRGQNYGIRLADSDD
jgi:hypothetical protein